jgi:hypothetical protein
MWVWGLSPSSWIYTSQSYVTCIKIIDTIILTNYTNDAYYSIQIKSSYRYSYRKQGRHEQLVDEVETTAVCVCVSYI